MSRNNNQGFISGKFLCDGHGLKVRNERTHSRNIAIGHLLN